MPQRGGETAHLLELQTRLELLEAMMFSRLAEKKIQEAIEAGEFDDLEGAGRPLDLNAYFAAPPELRASFAVLKNAKVLPREMEIRKEIDELKRRLESTPEEAQAHALRRRIEELTLQFNLLIERYRKR